VPNQALITFEREVSRPTVESDDEPILPSAAQIAKMSHRLPTVSTILPLSALTSRDNSICYPRIDWRTKRAWSSETCW